MLESVELLLRIAAVVSSSSPRRLASRPIGPSSTLLPAAKRPPARAQAERAARTRSLLRLRNGQSKADPRQQPPQRRRRQQRVPRALRAPQVHQCSLDANGTRRLSSSRRLRPSAARRLRSRRRLPSGSAHQPSPRTASKSRTLTNMRSPCSQRASDPAWPRQKRRLRPR